MPLPFPVTLALVPLLSFAAGTSISGFGPYRDFNRNHNFFDNMTKIHGSHSFKAGFTYNHYQKTENAGSGNQGTFAFTPSSFAAPATQYEQAFANFLVGNVLQLQPGVRGRDARYPGAAMGTVCSGRLACQVESDDQPRACAIRCSGSRSTRRTS